MEATISWARSRGGGSGWRQRGRAGGRPVPSIGASSVSSDDGGEVCVEGGWRAWKGDDRRVVGEGNII